MLEISATGDRPLEEVWDRYTRPALWPTWAPQVRGVRCDDEVIVAGSHGVVRGPALVRVPFRIESVDEEALSWSWRVGHGPLAVTMAHGLSDTGAGVRAWVRIAALAVPYAPIARFALRRLVTPS